jgi:CubicO group peptidase (beta-lactamase class C family)
MYDSGFDFKSLSHPLKATGYLQLNKMVRLPSPVVDSTVSFAAGALYSTTGDLFKWQRSIAAKKIISPDSWKKALTIEKDHYGYGLIIDSVHGKLRIYHGGGIHGFNALTVYFPQEDYTVILLSNVNTPFLGPVSNGLASIAFGLPYSIPEENREITLTAAETSVFTGVYEITPSFSITISLKGDNLFGQATGQMAFQLFPKSPVRFFLKAVDAEVEFYRDDKGMVTHLVLFQNGTELKGKKIQ